MRARTTSLGLALALALLLAGCGGGSDTSSSGTGHAAANPAGSPGDPAKASRTIAVSATNALRFDPGSLSGRAGETVTFKVTNNATVVHEFVLGDKKAQDEHGKMMKGMTGGTSMQDDGNAIEVKPGESKELTWTFAKAGAFQYACHVTGHYESGMVGQLTVS